MKFVWHKVSVLASGFVIQHKVPGHVRLSLRPGLLRPCKGRNNFPGGPVCIYIYIYIYIYICIYIIYIYIYIYIYDYRGWPRPAPCASCVGGKMGLLQPRMDDPPPSSTCASLWASEAGIRAAALRSNGWSLSPTWSPWGSSSWWESSSASRCKQRGC